MKILAFDASARIGAVAMTDDDKTVFSLHTEGERTHSETLLPLAIRGMDEKSPDEVDLIACAVGPGSFTGVRIAVALAKGLAAPKGLPCVGVSSLEALAYPYKDSGKVVCAMIDARRGNVYNALFDNGVRLCPDRLISLDALARELALMGREIIFAGDAQSPAENTPEMPQAECGREYADGADIARIAYERYPQNKEKYTAESLRPEYLRPTQAEREREDKQNG